MSFHSDGLAKTCKQIFKNIHKNIKVSSVTIFMEGEYGEGLHSPIAYWNILDGEDPCRGEYFVYFRDRFSIAKVSLNIKFIH